MTCCCLVAGCAWWSRGVGGGGTAVLDVLLEARWYRQPVDEIETDMPEHGELTEMLQRMHAAEPRDCVKKTDRSRQETGSAWQQVVQTAARPRRRHRVVDEVDDRRRRSLVAAAAAARRQRLRTETESTCNKLHHARSACVKLLSMNDSRITFKHHRRL